MTLNDRRLVITALFFLSVPVLVTAQDAIRVGVVEFEEKNNIGLENAGVIIAEWVVTELEQVGFYEVEERLFLEEVLEEQNLMLSGVIDEEQVPEIGQIYGVDAIVTGSVMKVGDQISVTGRIINVTTAEVLKTASVTTLYLSELQTEVVVLSNALSDVSREEWEIREDLQKRERPRLEVGGGIGYAFDNIGYSSVSVSAAIRYNSYRFLFWVEGAPVGGIKGVEFGAVVNIVPFIGLGASWGMVFDNALDFASSHYLTFGVVGRPRYNLELGIFLGFATGGTVWTDNNNGGEIKISPYFRFPGNYQVWFNWRIIDNLVLGLKYVGTELGDINSQLPPSYVYPSADGEFATGRITILAMYSFAIGKGR